MEVSFDVSASERKLIDAIVRRAAKAHMDDGRSVTKSCRRHWAMDITATHANGCRLDLERLSKAEDFTFWHDLSGIARHLDRSTGQLTGFFLPHTALPQAEAA